MVYQAQIHKLARCTRNSTRICDRFYTKPCFSCKSEYGRHPIPYQIFALGAKEQFLYYRYDFLHMLQSLDVITNHIILDPCPLKKGSISCPEASVRNYHYTLRNDPEEWSSHFHVGVPK